MIQQMSQRERVLATLVGTVALLFVTFLVFDYFLKNQRRLQGDLARNTGAVAAMKLQLAEKALWDERDAQLREKLPVLTVEDARAMNEVLEQVTQLARSKSLTVGTQNLGVVTRQAEYTSASVQLETTSTWPALVSFLYAVQSPGNFLVFESANLKRDDKDETQMRATFKIAKWFAPKAKPGAPPAKAK
jgi:Tfp pilus assembly protein PilO